MNIENDGKIEVIKATKQANRNTISKSISLRKVAAYCRVSTDTEDQMKSYDAQRQYYERIIKSNPSWELVGIYADADRTGTTTKGRDDFLRMIKDAEDGKIDLILTKSISRFARNTMDTLKYTRELKSIGVEIYFESENIKTMDMASEFNLTLFSSLYQQEVEATSERVKRGFKMRIKQGEAIGLQKTYGYDYEPKTKALQINEEEAKWVHYIFDQYCEGYGGTVIARKLSEMGVASPRGRDVWEASTVRGIIRNQIYIGNVVMGKSYILDPISKKKVDNHGERDMYILKDHHEPIIEKEQFEVAQGIINQRSVKHRDESKEVRLPMNRQYAFSGMVKCRFCGASFSRRTWYTGTSNECTVWDCVTRTKYGKRACQHSKAIKEDILERAFTEAYRQLCSENNLDVIDEFLERAARVLNVDNIKEQAEANDREIKKLSAKYSNLMNLAADGDLDKEVFKTESMKLQVKLNEKRKIRDLLLSRIENNQDIKSRIESFRKKLVAADPIGSFDRFVFESVIDYVIVGGTDENGNQDPYVLTYVFKTGFNDLTENPYDGKIIRHEDGGIVELLTFYSACSYYSFDSNSFGCREKYINNGIKVVAAVREKVLD